MNFSQWLKQAAAYTEGGARKTGAYKDDPSAAAEENVPEPGHKQELCPAAAALTNTVCS